MKPPGGGTYGITTRPGVPGPAVGSLTVVWTSWRPLVGALCGGRGLTTRRYRAPCNAALFACTAILCGVHSQAGMRMTMHGRLGQQATSYASQAPYLSRYSTANIWMVTASIHQNTEAAVAFRSSCMEGSVSKQKLGAAKG